MHTCLAAIYTDDMNGIGVARNRCWCGAPAVHAEHWYETTRAWCEEHTPWSGHFEWCGDRLVAGDDPCKALLARLRGQHEREASTWWAE